MKRTSLIVTAVAMLAGAAAVFSNIETVVESDYRPALHGEVIEEIEPVRTRGIENRDLVEKLSQRLTCAECFDICAGDQDCIRRCRERHC